jgi:DNA repair photolyase
MGTERYGAQNGRGAVSNPTGRFEPYQREAFDDGWGTLDEELPPLKTVLHPERSRTIITRNDSPDIGFDRSINPYKGCSHGCIYCYARPSHAYLGYSPGLDFETQIFTKPDAAKLLRHELSRPGYSPDVITLGANTDPYQPDEREQRISRAILEVLLELKHPVGIITKSALVQRDLDLLVALAEQQLVSVMVSVTTLTKKLARVMEPRAATPERRLETVKALAEAGVPVGVMCAPVIPAINDHEIERVLEASHAAGAHSAGYVLVRLPHEIKGLFADWLGEHFPERKEHVLNLIRDTRGGELYKSEWGTRMRGTGAYAETIRHRWKLACQRLGLNRREVVLDCSKFAVPPKAGEQLALL